MENKDLKFLKKHYGEKFMHLCRSLFPTLLETDGLLSSIIFKNFAPTPALYDYVKDAKSDFSAFINTEAGLKTNIFPETNLTPEELMDKAGYILFPECKSLEDMMQFYHFYAKGEELCTFADMFRLHDCRVWFAVKKNASSLNRQDFEDPQRQDEYGTSVISIQFADGHLSGLSIKNRYNHIVDKSDATFSNNLENIISGLTSAFINTYGIKFTSQHYKEFMNVLLEKGFVCVNDRFYARTCADGKGLGVLRKDDCAFYVCCNNNTMVRTRTGEILTFNPDKYCLVENYLFDIQRKTVINVYEMPKYSIIKGYAEDTLSTEEKEQYEEECETDVFIESLGNYDKMEIKSLKSGYKRIVFTYKDETDKTILLVNKNNQFVLYYNPFVETLDNLFLENNFALRKCIIPNVIDIDAYFLYHNSDLNYLYAPKLETIQEEGLRENEAMRVLNLPSLETMGSCFMHTNRILKEIYLPKCTFMDFFCFFRVIKLKTLQIDNLEEMGLRCFISENGLKTFDAPKLRTMQECFLRNTSVEKFNVPNLQVCPISFPKNASFKKLLNEEGQTPKND